MSAEEGRGLQAVRRVREVRERDAVLVLQEALAASRRSQERLGALEAMVAAHAEIAETDGDRYVAVRAGLAHLHQAVAQARREVAESETLAADAAARWYAARTQLRAVERLLERRAEEHRADLARAERSRIDELATQAWSRRRGA